MQAEKKLVANIFFRFVKTIQYKITHTTRLAYIL